MIIVSQNKKIITKSMELSIENTKRIMVESNCGKLYFLGEYETEERAKEVLQEIVKAANRFNNDTHCLVFEMPEE